VPFTLDKKDRARYCDLAGVSADVVASTGNHTFREKMLITHRGFSGPAILQISSYWKACEAVRLDLAPGRNITDKIRQAKVRNITAARSAFEGILAKRLADRVIETALDQRASGNWTNQALEDFERRIHEWDIVPAGTEGYDKAEVTAGGVDTDELSSQTMESRKVPGLYFVGEVVDVTGHLGGFNFQWAWASGAAAGRAL
jgi:predicted Rossmann fold flavoprotein